jgi:hypothetical protein
MTPDDLLFEPVGSIILKPVGNTGITRHPGSVWAEVQIKEPKKTYTDLATEIIDHAITEMPSLSDVRTQKTNRPRGVMDLVGIVNRFYDGSEEVWISRPSHMKPEPHRFTGRFGYMRACKMPQKMSKLGYITWFWVDTDTGHLPAIDLGLLVYHPGNKWWRVFTNKTDAQDYFDS